MAPGSASRAVVVYEPMFGNTGLVADATRLGPESAAQVAAVPVRKATADVVDIWS